MSERWAQLGLSAREVCGGVTMSRAAVATLPPSRWSPRSPPKAWI